MMEAVRLKEVDKDYRNHLQAFLNFKMKATKKSGKNQKPVYNSFGKFYDYEKAVEKARNYGKVDERFKGIGKLLRGGNNGK